MNMCMNIMISIHVHSSVLVRPFCGGVAPPILLSAPPTEVQITILHHQALLYLITMKPHDLLPNIQTTLLKNSTLKINHVYIFHYFILKRGWNHQI